MMEPDFLFDREKRQFDRKQLLYYLKVFHSASGKLAGYLGDISLKGVMLFAPDPIEMGKTYALDIELDTAFDLGDKMAFKGKALWCEKDVNPEFHVAGFEFQDLSQDSVDVVQYLIQKYGF